MKTLRFASAVGLLLLLAGTGPVAGGDDKPSAAPGAGGSSSGLSDQAVAKLLEGIVHFSDDDLRFRTPGGVTVFVDPMSWPTDEWVVQSGMVKPDLILVTHAHGDHFQPTIIQEYLNLNSEAILAGPPDVARVAREKGMKVSEIRPGQSYTMAGVTFRTVPAYFLEGESHPKHRYRQLYSPSSGHAAPFSC